MDNFKIKGRHVGCMASIIVAFAFSLYTATAIAEEPVNMTTGQSKEMTLTMQTLPNSRDYRYCELVVIYGEPHGSDIYTTTAHGECSLEWWDNLDRKHWRRNSAPDRSLKMDRRSGQWTKSV